MSHILHTSTVHKTTLADEGNSVYRQSSSPHNIKNINLWKLALSGHLSTNAQARDRTQNVLLTRTTPQPLGHSSTIYFKGRNFRGFAVFSQIRESLFPRNFSKDVTRESFFPQTFLKNSSSANILKKNTLL